MGQVLIFVIGGLIGGIGVWFWFDGKYKSLAKELEVAEKELKKEKEILGGFDEYNKKSAEIIAERKQKILDAMEAGSKMQTKKASEMLEVSRATAFRYLEELEQGGKIDQAGRFGRDVEYTIKQAN
jgi:predicted HTH transcriptional regulator